ncbi:hypothetical protein PR202_gb29559 [Eleusine coracana subsp. coracana]|uniref:Uncharacterized protein n=1 Tax=Eleusine coracana subsp. coracana TaxID=191504 RepID=A0AAV5FZL0_ELECO|nr:hypothetical protein PR202_gb29559 [Eleusine coracana subsp. coracana]
MASDAWLSVPCGLLSLVPPPPLAVPTAGASRVTLRCRGVTSAPAPRPLPWVPRGRWRPRASEAEPQGLVQNEEVVVDSNVLPYCSIDRKEKKTIGEMEQEFLQALQARARHFLESHCRIICHVYFSGCDLNQVISLGIQAFYYDKTAVMSNEEFDNLKEELMWEGSSVVMLSKCILITPS